jgi:transposase
VAIQKNAFVSELTLRRRRHGKAESARARSLDRNSLLMERVEPLMTIPAVGPITALTWALELGGVKRFSST